MRMGHAAVMAGLAFASVTGSARAEMFRFSYDAGVIPVSGTLTADATSTAGQYQVTSISGNRGVDTITGLSDYNGADNLIFFGGPSYVDASGLSYSYSAPSNGLANLSFNSTYLDTSFDRVPVPTTLTVPAFNVVFEQVSSVPLPASAPMFGVALLGLAAFGFASRRKEAPAAS